MNSPAAIFLIMRSSFRGCSYHRTRRSMPRELIWNARPPHTLLADAERAISRARSRKGAATSPGGAPSPRGAADSERRPPPPVRAAVAGPRAVRRDRRDARAGGTRAGPMGRAAPGPLAQVRPWHRHVGHPRQPDRPPLLVAAAPAARRRNPRERD